MDEQVTLEDLELLDMEIAEAEGLLSEQEWAAFVAEYERWQDERFAFEDWVADQEARAFAEGL